MEELFYKPILDQMYEFRKKEFEQSVYDKNEEIRSVQNKKCEIGKAFTEFLKEVITDEKNYNKLLKMFNDYEQEFATLIVVGAIVISVISLIKGNNNFSMVDTIKTIVKFKIMQKDYRYKIIEGCNQNVNTKF